MAIIAISCVVTGLALYRVIRPTLYRFGII